MPAIRVKKDNVTISVVAEAEDVSPEESYRVPGVTHRKRDVDRFVDSVNAMNDKDWKWGWCQVTVKAHFVGLTGKSHLAGCSYASKEDFVENSGYYEQMVEEALGKLQKEIDRVYSLIHVEA